MPFVKLWSRIDYAKYSSIEVLRTHRFQCRIQLTIDCWVGHSCSSIFNKVETLDLQRNANTPFSVYSCELNLYRIEVLCRENTRVISAKLNQHWDITTNEQISKFSALNCCGNCPLLSLLLKISQKEDRKVC